ncbi:MAG: transporter substrate-binding domain-containing protein [Bacteroides sp.]|jgi:membrane-bound lytic murein transglycosylase F|nr:transporter substrate-binding domain-containing protein [Bacteroides sp.]
MLKQRKQILLFVALSLLIISVFFVIRGLRSNDQLSAIETEDTIDLPQILERGVLRATTNYNSTNYFVYRGEPMGFHLELLQLFAAHIGVELEVYATNHLEENLNCLLTEGECDVIALDLTVTKSRSELVSFTEPHGQSRQVLIQRKPANWLGLSSSAIEDRMIRNQLDLAGKTIHVQRNSAFVDRLRNLMEEIGDSIYIVEVDKEEEVLIEMVATGEIDYTVSDEQIGRINQNYYAGIDARTPLSFPQNLSWAVRKDMPQLREAINEWMRNFKGTGQFASMYNKYYNNPRSVYIAKSNYNSLGGGNISVFDPYFKQYADIVGWDWRLIASLAYQESRFNHDAVSWAGAMGIMQLMPTTAATMEVDSTSSVPEHILAGVRYLRWLDNILKEHVKDKDERMKFVLASYNAGIGHVLDARRLAEKYGKDPNIWKDNVDYFILNKSKPKYYQDDVVRFGFARGDETYHYVYEVMERFEHYKNAVGS